MSVLRVNIELSDGLAGCEINVGNDVKRWDELDKQEQIKVCNMLAQFYNLFSPCIKEE